MRSAGRRSVVRSAERRVRRWLLLPVWVLMIVVAAGVLYQVASTDYREKNQAKYGGFAEYYEQRMQYEQNWIEKQQHRDGAVYLYEPETGTVGAVNPYFACIAVMGVLAGEPAARELDVARRYLIWHTERLIASDGVICDYSVDGTRLIATDTYDSIDSYVAVYLCLVSEYVRKGGNPDNIPGLESAVGMCIRHLKGLTDHGLTRVSYVNGTHYLMDNIEVLAAYRSMCEMFATHEYVKNWSHRNEYAAYVKEAVNALESAIKDKLWSRAKHHWETGINTNGTYIAYEGIERLYPDAIAQVYPIAWNEMCDRKEDIKEQYQRITDVHKWRDGPKDGHNDWPLFAYVAVKLGDIESAKEYIDEYIKRYENDRGYPMNTANAGWAAISCEALKDYYTELRDKSLFDALVERILNKTDKKM